MWTCTYCGCQAIAASLDFCPMCFKEAVMPKNTVEGGYSDKTVPAPDEDDTIFGEPVAEPEPPVALDEATAAVKAVRGKPKE